MLKAEFIGITSGDLECFCWAVDLDTFRSIRGEEPSKFDKSRFHDGLFKIYPGDIFGHEDKKLFFSLLAFELGEENVDCTTEAMGSTTTE